MNFLTYLLNYFMLSLSFQTVSRLFAAVSRHNVMDFALPLLNRLNRAAV